VLLVVGGGAIPGGGIPYLILNTYYIYFFAMKENTYYS